jgi:outer membrane protein OmpA-like peptidoglycan-associated protein
MALAQGVQPVDIEDPVFAPNVQFAAQATELDAEQRSRIYGTIAAAKRTYARFDVCAAVVGHAGADEGSSRERISLSEVRARNVAKRVEMAGIPASRIYVSSRGSTQPLSPLASPRAEVELFVCRPPMVGK